MWGIDQLRLWMSLLSFLVQMSVKIRKCSHCMIATATLPHVAVRKTNVTERDITWPGNQPWRRARKRNWNSTMVLCCMNNKNNWYLYRWFWNIKTMKEVQSLQTWTEQCAKYLWMLPMEYTCQYATFLSLKSWQPCRKLSSNQQLLSREPIRRSFTKNKRGKPFGLNKQILFLNGLSSDDCCLLCRKRLERSLY